MRRLAVPILLLWMLAPIGPAAAQSPTPKAEPRARRPARSGPRMYMGRPIAEVMSYHGADWLVRETREAEERPDAMLDALKIAPGSTVADIGAGVGYTSLRLSRRVGPGGTVLATDVQPQMLKLLRTNAREAGITNVKPILCTPTDTKLPDAAVDLALMVDVYHECSDPEATLKGLRRALKPGGRLVLVEFRAEDRSGPAVDIKPEHKMTLAQVRKELEPQGFTFRESIETLPCQRVIIFERPAGE